MISIKTDRYILIGKKQSLTPKLQIPTSFTIILEENIIKTVLKNICDWILPINSIKVRKRILKK
jgi:hypothetical protein